MTLEERIDNLIAAINANTHALTSGVAIPATLSTSPTPPVSESIVEESVATSDNPSVIPTTIEDVPPVDKRPFPTKPPQRTPTKVKDYERALESGDQARIAAAELAMNKYFLSTATRNQKRLNNIEPEGAKEATDLDMAKKYAEIEINHYQKLIDGNVVPSNQAPAAPAENAAPAAPAEEQLVVDTRGAPDGYMMTDVGDQTLTYDSYLQANWSDQQLLDGGLMAPIPAGAITMEQAASDVTLADVRKTMMDLTASKPQSSTALIGCITAMGYDVLEDVPVTEFQRLINDMASVHAAL